MVDSPFPDLFGEDVAPEPIKYSEVAAAIQSLINVSAACALAGDMAMGRAFMQAVSPIIAEAMIRWPTAPDLAATQEQMENAASMFSIESQPEEGSEMNTENNQGPGTQEHNPNAGDDTGVKQDDVNQGGEPESGAQQEGSEGEETAPSPASNETSGE